MVLDRMTLGTTMGETLDQRVMDFMDRKGIIRRVMSTRRGWTLNTSLNTRSVKSLMEGQGCSRASMVRGTRTWRVEGNTRKKPSRNLQIRGGSLAAASRQAARTVALVARPRN